MLAIDPEDAIVGCFQRGTSATWVNGWKDLANYDSSIPLTFRGMTQRKTVSVCEEQRRDYYYIDTGYIGNLSKKKVFHRIVKNGMQHSNPVDVPDDRFKRLAYKAPYTVFHNWRKGGDNILLVTPSDKPCKFYGIDRDTWVKETVATLKKFTDKNIIIRDKALRRERVGSGNIYSQFVEDRIYAVVTYNSIAAIEAIGFGIPAFTLAPTAADSLCLKDITKIESPFYPDKEQVEKWQHWLAYCQYTTGEMVSGDAIKIIRKYNLC